MKINLGERVRDTISGVEGTVVGRTEWLHGCVRLTVQPEGAKDGVPYESFCVDEPGIERLPAQPFKRGDGGPAGPRDDPARRTHPTR